MSKINKEAGIFLLSPVLSSLLFGEKKTPNALAIAFRNYPKLPGIKMVMLHVLCANNITIYLSSDIRNIDANALFIHFSFNYAKLEFVKVHLSNELL